MQTVRWADSSGRSRLALAIVLITPPERGVAVVPGRASALISLEGQEAWLTCLRAVQSRAPLPGATPQPIIRRDSPDKVVEQRVPYIRRVPGGQPRKALVPPRARLHAMTRVNQRIWRVAP